MTLRAIPGEPGKWYEGVAPDGMADIRAIGNQCLIDLDRVHWYEGQYVVLGNGRKVHWNGEEWKIGAAPKPPAPPNEGHIDGSPETFGADLASGNDETVISMEIIPVERAEEIAPGVTMIGNGVTDEEWERIQEVMRNAPK